MYSQWSRYIYRVLAIAMVYIFGVYSFTVCVLCIDDSCCPAWNGGQA